jgi:hypothetical protein
MPTAIFPLNLSELPAPPTLFRTLDLSHVSSQNSRYRTFAVQQPLDGRFSSLPCDDRILLFHTRVCAEPQSQHISLEQTYGPENELL